MLIKKNYNSCSRKQNNRYLILNALRRVQDVSIATLAANIHLSKPTIKKVLDHYINLGLVNEVGKGLSTEDGGKKPSLYKFNKNYSSILSLHLGPDFINIAVLNFLGEITHSEFCGIDKDITVEKVIDLLVHYINKYSKINNESGIPVYALALSLPGVTDPNTGVLQYSPHFGTWKTNVSFVDEIRKHIDTELKIYVDNINRYEAFAEMIKGKAIGYKNFATIDTLEEGVGAGFITNGSMRHGGQNIAGEIGHTIVNPLNGADCICGGKGCLEAEVSQKNVYRMIEEGKLAYPDSMLFQSGEKLSLSKLFLAATNHDPLAVEIMDKITTFFALGINNIIMVNDPEIIILQGVYNEAGAKFLQTIKEKTNNISLLSMNRDINICFSDFDINRGVLGAGIYALCDYFAQTELYQ